MPKLELQEIVTPGSLIRTKHPKSEWIPNIVQSVYNDYIKVDLTKDYMESMIHVGDEIKGKYFGSEVEYLFEGKVDSIDISNSSFITIHIDKINIFENIRSYNRYDIHMISKVSISRSSPIYCIVTSVSSSGVSLLAKSDFPLDSEAYIEVFVNTGSSLSFTGKIMRKSISENGFEHGIKITEIDQQNQDILTKLLDHLKNYDNSLINKYLSNLS